MRSIGFAACRTRPAPTRSRKPEPTRLFPSGHSASGAGRHPCALGTSFEREQPFGRRWRGCPPQLSFAASPVLQRRGRRDLLQAFRDERERASRSCWRETSWDCSRAIARRSFSRSRIAGMMHERSGRGLPESVGWTSASVFLSCCISLHFSKMTGRLNASGRTGDVYG
jgi:hypothetical protein